MADLKVLEREKQALPVDILDCLRGDVPISVEIRGAGVAG